MRKLSIAFVLFFSAQTVFNVEEAQSLPQMSAKCDASNVNVPEPNTDAGLLDAGFHFSKDCNTIYVLPPAQGESVLSAFSPTASVGLCTTVSNLIEASGIASQSVVKAQRKIDEAIDENRPKDAGPFLAIMPGLRQAATAANDDLDEYSAIEATSANVLLKLPYSVLLSKYKELNPEKDIKRVPIKGGFLSISVRRFDPIDPTDLLLSTRSGVLEVTALGAMTGDLQDFNIVAPEGIETVNFSDSTTGKVVLSLNGACPFYDQDAKQLVPYDFSNPNQSMIAYLTAQYTYFFPIQSSASYKITYDNDILADIFRKHLNTKTGEINASVVASDIIKVNGTEAITIEIIQDVNNTLPSEESIRERFKEELAASFVHDVLSKLGEIVDDTAVPENNVNLTGFADEERQVRHCRRRLFSKRCHTHTYKVKVPVTAVNTRIREIFAEIDLRYSESVNQTKTLLLSGTSGFPVVVKD